MSKLTTFDISQYLDSEEMIAEYLSQVLRDGDTDEFLEAIGHIAKPRFETVMKVINSLGVRLQVSV